MLYLAIKALISGVIVAAASEVARRWPGIGGLIVSLPLVSLLTFIWVWMDTRNSEKVAELAQSAFWFFLPSMPMFLALPAMLRAGCQLLGGVLDFSHRDGMPLPAHVLAGAPRRHPALGVPSHREHGSAGICRRRAGEVPTARALLQRSQGRGVQSVLSTLSNARRSHPRRDRDPRRRRCVGAGTSRAIERRPAGRAVVPRTARCHFRELRRGLNLRTCRGRRATPEQSVEPAPKQSAPSVAALRLT